MSDLGHLKTELPKPRPLATPTSQRFWHALSDERVEIQRCAECQAWVYYPRSRCPECLSDQLVWTEVSGEGVIFTFTVSRQPTTPSFADEVPQIIAVVELTEGVHVTSVIVDAEPEQVAVGASVVPFFEHADDGLTLLKHRLAAD